LTVPAQPKVYHIVHVDRLPSIIASNGLFCDAEMAKHAGLGTTIGMSSIKARRLNELTLDSHPGLYVGECVPFYFCPRSIMLYLIHQANHPELSYRGGQGSIVHLEFDLQAAVQWAEANDRRWAFTLSNAGSRFFEDRCDLSQLHEIEWDAVQARNWASCKEGKQAEFLVEKSFPWELVERVGVLSNATFHQAAHAITAHVYKPVLEIRADWYY
jgi:hypothetical protein